MKRIFIALLTAAAAIAAQAQTRHYAIDVHDFTAINTVQSINIVYSSNPDSLGFVAFDCAPEMASHLLFSNKKNVLKVEIDNEGLPAGPLPVLYLYSSALLKAENSGDSTMVLRNLKPVNTLELKLMGNGKLIAQDIKADEVNASLTLGNGTMTLSGEATKANFSNIGTGTIQASDLKASFVNCKILGTGLTECFADQTLSVLGTGSGTVIYHGKPRDIKKRTIGGKVKAAQ